MGSRLWITKENGDFPHQGFILEKFPHPRTGVLVFFALNQDANNIFEIQKIDSQGFRSWFIGDSILKDGSLYTLSPFDPLFLLLPILDAKRNETEESPGMFISLDDVLYNEQYPNLSQLGNLTAINDKLEVICDIKVIPGEESLLRLNNEKVQNWLQAKTLRLLNHYDKHNVFKLYRNQENIESNETERKEKKLEIVIQLIADYLPTKWADILKNSYSWTERKVTEEFSHYYVSSQITKTESNDSRLNETIAQTKKQKISNGVKALKKANIKGMANISSFFGKKMEKTASS